MDRRSFLQYSGMTGILMMNPAYNLVAKGDNLTKVTILHTNDVHSRIDPFPDDGGRNSNLGGASKRAEIIEQIRKDVDHCLLLDSGDMFQGTPYFNYFNGELEVKLMSEMRYDASTIGNHEFDSGISNLVKQMDFANFPLVNSNYIVEDNELSTVVQKDLILERGGIKFGILGLGIEIDGLVSRKLIENTIYTDPIKAAQIQADKLKLEKGCDIIICLSHLGYKYDSQQVSDVVLASQTRNIDIILGGHTHTFMKQPDVTKNLDGNPVVINQAGWAGIMLGRLDLVFEKNSVDKCVTCSNLFIK